MIFLQKPETQSQIEVFSMQITFAEAKFTAADFFTLNKMLIFFVNGALFTYLIILIQFTNESGVCYFFQHAL